MSTPVIPANLPSPDGHRQAGHQHLLARAYLVEVGFHQAGATSLATAEIPLAVANAEFIARGVELGVTGGGIYGLLRDVSVLFPGEVDLRLPLPATEWLAPVCQSASCPS